MWGHNVNMAAGHIKFILYVKNYNLGDYLNFEVKPTCLLYKVSVNIKGVHQQEMKEQILLCLYFSGQEKHSSEVPFVTVRQFSAINKRQEASTQTLKIYIGRIRDWC
jgi:galactokinase/mevalonate kinase-like predicted kinase